MGLKLGDFLGRTIAFLGSNVNVNLGVAADYPIFTPTHPNLTFVQFVVLFPNSSLTAWNAGLCTINCANQTWASNQQLSDHAEIPSVIYAKSAQADQAGPSSPGVPFTLGVVDANALNGIATAAAYGWTL